MLEFNLDAVRRAMAEAVCDEPVGFVIDATDRGGRRLAARLLSEQRAVSLEDAEAELDRQTREYRAAGRFPTLVLAADWAFAAAVMPTMSPTATANLTAARRGVRAGLYLVVAIGSGGNTYAFIEVSRPVRDGQHRVNL